MDADEYTNPAKTTARRLREAGDDGANTSNRGGKDMGDIPNEKIQMSQAQFSGYSKRGNKSNPPADMLKKQSGQN